jgi:RNA polymerase sigma factor (sigma-70 family)
MLQLGDPTTTRTDSGAGDTVRQTPLSDAGAWERLVAEHQDHLLRVASSYRMGPEAHDVVQKAWLRLLERGADIRDWNAVGAWLTTVVRRECLRVIRSRQRERLYEPEDFERLTSTVDDDPTAEDLLVAEESRQLVRRAMQSLPQRQHDLLQALSDPDAPGYAVISERLGMPVGSMGPTRQRALRRLRAALTEVFSPGIRAR